MISSGKIIFGQGGFKVKRTLLEGKNVISLFTLFIFLRHVFIISFAYVFVCFQVEVPVKM